MGDRHLVRTPPPSMRGGVLEPVEHENMPLQAVIVKNGRIFIDDIQPLEEADSNPNPEPDENRQVENFDLLEDVDDEDFDDEFLANNKFSQEAFDSFMQAGDNDEEHLGDIMLYNQLHAHKEEDHHLNSASSHDVDSENGYDMQELYRHGYFDQFYQIEPRDKDAHQRGLPEENNVPFSSGNGSMAMGHHAFGGYHPADSFGSTFQGDVDRLLREDQDARWRYVPLYPETYYSSGQEVQRVSVITDLPNLLRDNHAECMKRVVPKVREVLHVANLDMQLAAATAFLQILEGKLVSVDDYRKTFLQTILTSVDSKNEEVANSWLETLLSVIDLLPKDVVKQDILSIAVHKGQLSQTLQARLSCCKILGKVSSKFENFVVKNEVLPVVSSLCGDVEYDVRACMCQRLDVVAHGLGLELTKSKLLPQLIELSEDESQAVICACLETTANIVEMLDREGNVNAIIPMVKELCEKALSHTDSTLPTSSKLLGRFCHSLLEYMTLEDKSFFQEYFKKLCKVGMSEKKHKEDASKLLESLDVFESVPDTNSETRRYAAYNFPAMVLFVGAKLFRLELYPSFSQLCKDSNVIVRRCIASGFHEIAKLLGNNVGIIFPEFNALLNDTDIDVLKAIVPNFKDIMSALSSIGFEQFTEHRAHVVQDVVTAFLRADSIIFESPCWRTKEAMIQSMECLHTLCNNDFIFTKVLPLLLIKLKNGRALPVKVAAAKTLAVLTRKLKYKAQRDEIVLRLIEEFHDSHSCYQRSLFIDLARCYLEVNSRQSFKDNFYEHILNMKSDPVATVRLKMLTILPEMKKSLKLPRDQPLRTALDTVLRQVTVYDNDMDVQTAAHQMSEELPLIQEGSDTIRTNRRNLTKEEEEDLRREDEEKESLGKEEKEKKDEEARLAKGSEKRNSVSGNKKDTQSKIPGTKKGIPVKPTVPAGSKGDGIHQMTKRSSIAGTAAASSTGKEPETKNKPQKVKIELLLSPQKGANSRPNSPSIAKRTVKPSEQQSQCLIKSKSTTCIPSVSLIPRLEQRPSTPPRKEVRKIPVFVAHKTVSSPSLSSTGTKRNSPQPARKSLSNATSPAGSSTASSTRRGSASNVSSTLARRGSIGSANSTGSDNSVKAKSGVSSRQVNAVGSRSTKKISK